MSRRGSIGVILLLWPWCEMGVSGQRHAPAALPPGNTRYPLYSRLSLEALSYPMFIRRRKPTYVTYWWYTSSVDLYSTHTYIYIYIYLHKKIKWFRYRPGVAQRVGRGIALLFHDRSTRRRWVVSSTPRPYFTIGKDTVPIAQETEWAPGPVWTGGKSRPHRDSIPDRPARSQSLYRLSYPAHHTYIYIYIYIYT